MKPIYKIDKTVGMDNHSGCVKAFCPMCYEYLGEYDIRDCKCGGWWKTEGSDEYEITERLHLRTERTAGEMLINKYIH